MSEFRKQMLANAKKIDQEPTLAKNELAEKAALLASEERKRQKRIKEQIMKSEPTIEKPEDEIIGSNLPGEPFDDIDLEIIKLLLKKYHNQGTNIIRADQKNPFPNDFNRLGYLLGNQLGKANFKLLNEKGFLKKTKFGGQFEIKNMR